MLKKIAGIIVILLDAVLIFATTKPDTFRNAAGNVPFEQMGAYRPL